MNVFSRELAAAAEHKGRTVQETAPYGRLVPLA
jgi:hypothetical protein